MTTECKVHPPTFATTRTEFWLPQDWNGPRLLVDFQVDSLRSIHGVFYTTVGHVPANFVSMVVDTPVVADLGDSGEVGPF